jgi:hypothetical protein
MEERREVGVLSNSAVEGGELFTRKVTAKFRQRKLVFWQEARDGTNQRLGGECIERGCRDGGGE